MNIKKLCKNKKGFTLIEIIVVVVILAVLMAVAVPSVLKYLDEADNAKYMAQGRAVMTTAQAEIVKAFTGDKMIDATELTAIKAAATYNDNASGLETVANVEIYSAATVTQVGDAITISSATPFAAQNTAQNAIPNLSAIYAEIGGKFIVATPNGKIYVSGDRPTGAPVAPTPGA